MKSDALKGLTLLGELGEEERLAIARELECVELSAGERVFGEGETADGIVFVLEGRLVGRSDRAPGRGEFEAGAALGALSLVAGGRREATVETASRSLLLLLRRRGYERLGENAPRAACRLMEAILREQAMTLRHGLDRFLKSSS